MHKHIFQIVFTFVFFLFLPWIAPVSFQIYAVDVQVIPDVEYLNNNGHSLKLDVCKPVKTYDARPAIILIHGGGFVAKDKSQFNSDIPTTDPNYLVGNHYCKDLAGLGFVAATINYTLATGPLSADNTYPVQQDEAQYAVRWLRANAATYGIDTNKIASWGRSAGATLAEMLGMIDTRDSYLGLAEYSSRVTTVISEYGIADFTDIKYRDADPAFNSSYDGFIKTYFNNRTYELGTTDYQDASPQFNLTNPVPVLALHGESDTVVPYQESQAFVAALQQKGVDAQLVNLVGDHKIELSEASAIWNTQIKFLYTHLNLQTNAPLKYCLGLSLSDRIECDLQTDKKINSMDAAKWLGVARATPDSRFGATLAVTEFSSDVSPSWGQPLFNKTHQYQVLEAGFAPESDFNWARNELNAGNKTQFIHTNWAYYQEKDGTNDVYLGPDGQTPEWLTPDDLAELAAAGYPTWQSVPDDYPVWRQGLTRYVQGTGYQKDGFAAGTMVFYGWLDKNGTCVPAGSSGDFNVYLQGVVRDPQTKLISPVIQNNKRVPKGEYNDPQWGYDVLPAPNGEWIQPCNAHVYQEPEFKDFITRNPGNTYFVYNEMGMAFLIGQDVMSPTQYAPHYAYYLNIFKGFDYGPNCSQPALDPTAKVLIGISGQAATWASDRSKIWGDWIKWYQDFVTEWISLSGQPKCTIPTRPFYTVPKTVNGTTYNTVPTDGIAYYEYAGYPNYTVSPPTVRIGSCTEANQVLNTLENLIITDANIIRNDFNTLFSSALPYLKEYGIDNTKLSDTTLDFQSELYSYWKNYLNKCTTGDCYSQYETEMSKYAKQDLYVVSQVTKWLKDTAFSAYQIQRAAWLPMWHDLAWKKINGQGVAPLSRMKNPGTTLGYQLFAPADAPVPFISPQLTGIYAAIRGQTFGCVD